MFKWMISGHRNHKHKTKLNNAIESKSNILQDHNHTSDPSNTNSQNGAFQSSTKGSQLSQDGDNGEINRPISSKEFHPQQILFKTHKNGGSLTVSCERLDKSNEYSSLEAVQNQRDQLDNDCRYTTQYEELRQCLVNGSSTDVTNIGSQPNLHRLPPTNSFSPSDVPLQAPNTCTLPRRSIFRETSNQRFRSPSSSNCPAEGRVPPSYSRHHQSSEHLKRLKRPSIPPPPPRIPKQNFDHPIKSQNDVSESMRRNCEGKRSEDFGMPSHLNEFEAKFFASGMDSGFESMSNPSNCASEHNCESSCRVRNEPQNRGSNYSSIQKDFPSKSTEDLLTASSVSGSNFHHSHHNELHQSSSEQRGPKIIPSDSVYPNTNNGNPTNNPLFQSKQNMGYPRVYIPYQDIIPRCKVADGRSCNNNAPSQEMFLKSQSDKEIVIERLDNENQNYVEFSIRENESNEREENEMKPYKRLPSKANCTRDACLNTNSTKNISNPINLGCRSGLAGFGDSNGNQNQNVASSYTNGHLEQGSAKTLVVKDYDGKSHCHSQQREGMARNQECKSTSSLSKPDNVLNFNQNYANTSPTSLSWIEWTQQLDAYKAWVNSQLSKRPDKKLISDLRKDFQTGSVFADLIEILAGEKVAGVVSEADTLHLRRENLDRVLQFMSTKRIKMTHITSKEIAEGNLKSIMRVILALAAHYKPQSVKEGSATTTNGHRNEVPQGQSENPVYEIESKTKVLTHDIGVGPDTPLQLSLKTPKLLRKNLSQITSEEDSSISQPFRRQPSLTNNIRSPSPTIPVYENLIDTKRTFGSARWAYDSLRASHKFHWSSKETRSKPCNTHRTFDKIENENEVSNSSFNSKLPRCNSLDVSTDLDSSVEKDYSLSENPHSYQPCKPAAFDFWQGLQGKNIEEGYEHVHKEEIENPFKYHTIHRISGRRKLPQIPGCSSSASSTNSRTGTPVTVSPSSPSRSIPEQIDNRKNEIPFMAISNVDNSFREPEGRSQNSSPAASIDRNIKYELWRELKEEELRVGLHSKELLEDSKFGTKLNVIFESKNGEPRKSDERKIDFDPQSQMQQQAMENLIARRNLENEKAELSRRVYQKDETICDLRKQILQREREIFQQKNSFEETLKNVQSGKYRVPKSEMAFCRAQNREEIQVMREAIDSLRGNFGETDSYQHTLDTLEQAISILLERTQLFSSVTNEDLIHNTNGGSRNEKKVAIRGPVEAFTKIIYFTDRTVTPFMSTINKKLGEISLRDFKNLFDRSGYFRFHFKNHDPEYGLVKEEITNDDDILPGVDGKIIAWVEEDQD